MKFRFLIFLTVACSLPLQLACATDADSTTITITGHTPGPTPFISVLTLDASETDQIQSIQFSITPKPGSVTRALSSTYSSDYLQSRGYLNTSDTIYVPVYGLYDGYTNTVTLTYLFVDGSSKTATTTISTETFDDPCDYKNPTVLLPRTNSTSLSYDFMYLKGGCGDDSPVVMDTDGALRWVGDAGVADYTGAFFDNAFYLSDGTYLYRLDLDGTVTFLHNYDADGFNYLHHNIDPGKYGLIIDVDTADQLESVNAEIDLAGNVLKVWNLADIISAAMVTGGDDPSQFVYPAPNDWFHNNSVTYNRADDSIIVSSRENFLICLDYETSAIKWILGDPTKAWYQFPSLRKYALALADGSLPPIGQHAVSITYDQDVMVFDNGFYSRFQNPPGALRDYSAPRKYQIDLATNTATEVWNYEKNQSVWSPICSSIYEDAPYNYLIDYAYVGGFFVTTQYAQILGLDASGAEIFYYQYPSGICEDIFNATPIHLENSKFPAVGPQAVNLSTRGVVSNTDQTLIGGFIVTGLTNKELVLRVLGPSLTQSGLTGTVPNPVLTVYDSSGAVVASNDNWASDPNSSVLEEYGLAPTNPLEAALALTLPPAAYTVVASSAEGTPGLGLVEVYDLTPATGSLLANLSTRGFVETGDDVLISGFIVGNAGNATLVVRALGPSLALANTLSDPNLTIYDSNGTILATNDNWQDNVDSVDLQKIGLAPTNASEAALILHPPAGSYSAIVSGSDDATGIGLVEVYDLD